MRPRNDQTTIMRFLSFVRAAAVATVAAAVAVPVAAQEQAASPAQAGLPDRAAATAAVARYLARDGNFCLGKMDWPVDLSALDERARGRDVQQMPVLESLGLASSAMATAMRAEGRDAQEGARPEPVAVRRYTLTPAGLAWMREREIVVPGPDGDRVVRRSDLCAATLALDALVDWKAAATGAPAGAAPAFVATYTYVATPAPWATGADFRRVFPMAARVIDGTRVLRLKQRFQLVGGAWVPAGLAD